MAGVVWLPRPNPFMRLTRAWVGRSVHVLRSRTCSWETSAQSGLESCPDSWYGYSAAESGAAT
eukprot:2709114-Prymnesium_polylepis.1